MNHEQDKAQPIAGDGTKEIEPPIGDFILKQKDIKPLMREDGAYYHYVDVCKLLKRHHPATDWENKAKDMKQTPIQTAIEEIAEGEYLPAAELKWVTKILQSLLPYERECIEQAVKDNIPSLNILTEQNLSDIAKDYFTSTYKQ